MREDHHIARDRVISDIVCAWRATRQTHEKVSSTDPNPRTRNQSIEQMTGTMIGTHGDLFVREKEFGNINRVESETMTTLFLFRRRKAMTAFVRR